MYAYLRTQNFPPAFSRGQTLSRRKRHTTDMVRYTMQDSSPICNYDWLMTRAKEIPRSQLVACAQSFLTLIEMTQSYADDLRGDRDDDGEDAWSIDDDECGFEPQDAWRPHLEKLSQIQDYCYTPANLSAGCRSVAHQMSATSLQLHWDIPSEASIDCELSRILGNTSDMGGEMSGPSFRVQQAMC